MSDTTINDNGSGDTGGGIEIAPASGTASVVLNRVKMRGNAYGMGLTSASGTIAAVMRHSVVAGSADSGIVVDGAGSFIFFTVEE